MTTLLASTIGAAALLPLAKAYTFNIDSTPQQCSNLSISIIGNDGTPPYSALILPFGQSPLPNNVEARRIVEHKFDGTSASFQLRYPTNSQFVLVVSDSRAFGSGGTSVAATVTESSDASCYDSTQSVSPDFFYNIQPVNQIVQCQASRLWWLPTTVQGIPNFYGVIPGGQSFSIPTGQITNETTFGTGFSWTPSLRAGTTIMLGAGDDRGFGAGGSVTYFVAAGTNPNAACLNNDSPSSTPGSPAGGSYPTSTNQAGNNTSDSNIGAIVGGVIGGLIALIALVLIILFYRRRRRYHRHQQMLKERPDLFTDNENESVHRPSSEHHNLPQPEPYIVPTEPSEAGGTENASGAQLFPPSARYSNSYSQSYSDNERDRRLSYVSSSASMSLGMPPLGTGSGGAGGFGFGYHDHPGGPAPPSPMTTSTSAGGGSQWGGASTSASTSRKSPAPPPLRPVNIIQHDDAGAVPEDGAAETVELPPAYTNIRR